MYALIAEKEARQSSQTCCTEACLLRSCVQFSVGSGIPFAILLLKVRAVHPPRNPMMLADETDSSASG